MKRLLKEISMDQFAHKFLLKSNCVPQYEGLDILLYKNHPRKDLGRSLIMIFISNALCKNGKLKEVDSGLTEL